MKIIRLPILFAATTVTFFGTRCARADLIKEIPFSIVASQTGPASATIDVPQFDPAQGVLNSLTLTLSTSFQFALEVFNSGTGAVSATVQDTLTFNGAPIGVQNVFSATIPPDQPVYTFMPPPLAAGTLTDFFGPNLAAVFTGTGTVPFQLSLQKPAVLQFSGQSTSSVLAFGGVSGTVTADYAFTPAASPVPEPGCFGAAGLGLVAIGLLARRKRRLSWLHELRR